MVDLKRYIRQLAATGVALFLSLACGPGEKAGLCATAFAQEPDARQLQGSFTKVAKQIEPAVVNVATTIEEKVPVYEFYFGSNREVAVPKEAVRKMEGSASGVIISADGHILTNEHVVHDAKTIRVTLSDKSVHEGRVVGRNTASDIAIIKIDAGRKLPFAALGDSDKMQVGDWVVAVGFPFGLQETLTVGVVSAFWKSLTIEGSNYANMIQTDAPLNKGNSGGALCNIDGEVIGINTAIFSPTGAFAGIGFAIPINSAKETIRSSAK
jgi:S1-C subfamily serine protease